VTVYFPIIIIILQMGVGYQHDRQFYKQGTLASSSITNMYYKHTTQYS